MNQALTIEPICVILAQRPFIYLIIKRYINQNRNGIYNLKKMGNSQVAPCLTDDRYSITSVNAGIGRETRVLVF